MTESAIGNPNVMLKNVPEPEIRITPAACRAARALLNWPQETLAKEARVAKQTLVDFERGARTPYRRTLLDIQAALEGAGIEFWNDGEPGARLRARAG